MLLSVLPAWFPSDLATVFIIVLLGSLVAMNRGKWWVLNVISRSEPLLVAAGATIAVASGDVAEMVGAGSSDAWLVAGVFIALLGVVMWRGDGGLL